MINDSQHVLLVADWSVDPQVVLAEASRRGDGLDTTFAVVVPAWLHGLDWVGDPRTSIPCAQRQLDAICELAASAGLTTDRASDQPLHAML